MKHFIPPADIHPADCRCGACEYARPDDGATAAALGDIALKLALGIGAGALAILAIRWATGGPSLAVMFGGVS